MRAMVALRRTLVFPSLGAAISNQTRLSRLMFGFGVNESARDHIISFRSQPLTPDLVN